MRRCRRILVVSATWVLLFALVVPAFAAPARATHAATMARAAPVTFAGMVHRPLGDARLARDPHGLRVRSVFGSGRDGVSIAVGAGVTALQVRAIVPADTTLPAGAYLEIGSHARRREPGQSNGALRMTRQAGDAGYEISGWVLGAPRATMELYCNGTRAYQDERLVVMGVASPLARVPHPGLALGSSLNDAMNPTTTRSARAGLLLRWQWSKVQTVTVTGRPGGAADTTVDADEICLIGAPAAPGAGLRSFELRGKDLGEVLIESERPVRGGASARATAAKR